MTLYVSIQSEWMRFLTEVVKDVLFSQERSSEGSENRGTNTHVQDPRRDQGTSRKSLYPDGIGLR